MSFVQVSDRNFIYQKRVTTFITSISILYPEHEKLLIASALP